MLTFLVFFVALSALVYGYPAWRLLPDLPLPAGLRWALAAGALGAALLPLLYMLVVRESRQPEWVRRAVARVAYLGMACAIALFDAALLRDLALAGAWSLGLAPTRAALPGAVGPDLAQASAAAAVALSMLIFARGFYSARRAPAVRHVTVALAHLPAPMVGLRIVHLTDLHVGPTIRRPFVSRVADAVEGLSPDLIAFTGDLADGAVAELADQVEPLSRLRAPLGRFFVPGNHEYYAGAPSWVDAVRRLGFDVLLNEHRVVEAGGARLVVGGLPDPAGAEMLPDEPAHGAGGAPFRGAPPGLRLLLAHQPRTCMAAAGAGFDLGLCGHTHGGQIFPWSALVRLQQPLLAGLHRAPGGGWIYVSCGAGYWGPPLRLGAPSEITCLTLARADAAATGRGAPPARDAPGARPRKGFAA